ncbi:MAG: proprotein convertase P-domain-containing protein, partial [Nitrosomonas sp.]|nr:proprotein convertase P-domain-containing protein [Nitrosomonas sp.]
TPSLGALNGMPIQGTWKLNVADLARRDKGKLQRWNLEIGLAPSNTIRAEQSSSLKIPDNNPDGISDTLAVKKTGVVQSIKIWLDITHTYIGDLRVQLIAPSGKTVLLHDRSGGNQDNLIKTYDAANLPLLQELTGEKVKGSWILKVFDLAGRDVGKLNHWGVEVSI